MPSAVRSFHEIKGSSGCSMRVVLKPLGPDEDGVLVGRWLELDCKIQEEGLGSTDNCRLGAY